MLSGPGAFVAIIPASQRHIQDSENVQRANDVALLARANGFGVFVLEGRGGANATQELMVLVVGQETQVVAFARKVVREADAASEWFLFCRTGRELVKENIDWTREECLFERDGFTLPDGSGFKFETAYTLAQFSTAWGRSPEAEFGELLKAV